MVAVAFTMEKLAAFSLGPFLCLSQPLAGPRVFLSLSQLRPSPGSCLSLSQEGSLVSGPLPIH